MNLFLLLAGLAAPSPAAVPSTTAFSETSAFEVTEDEERIRISGSALEASIRKRGYVSGIEGQSLVDRKTGFYDQGFGLDIVDWIM